MADTIQGVRQEIPANQKSDKACYHCGADFDEVVIEAHSHKFCCEGCKTVYEILHVNGLDTYYEIEKSAGIKTSKFSESKFQFLDNDEVKKTLLDFSDGGTSSVTFFIPKIHCSACIWLLENLHVLSKGITSSRVNFLKKEVHVVFNDEEITLRKLVELLVSIGYEPAINLNGGKNNVKAANKTELIKLGVAGFAFGNIMMLSLPDYFDQFEGLTTEFKNLFGYLNLFLALPVLLYSANSYFISAFKSLKRGIVNVDLPISVGIIILFVRSSYEIITGTGTGFMDSFTMFVFLLLVGKWYQNRTYQALSFERDYTSYFPIAITKILTDDTTEIVSVKEVQVGDELLIKNQEIIPCDATLISDRANIDYSFVTGEAEPIKKASKDALFAGGKQVGEAIKVKVEKEISQSYLTSLWNQDAFTKEDSTYNSIVDKTSRYFTLFVLFVSLLSLVFWWSSGVATAIKIFTSVLIIACPCALALTLPFAFGTTMSIFGNFKLYLKNSNVVEKFAGIDTVVFDKTGTLTQSGETQVNFVGNASSEQLNVVASMCQNSMHPLSQAIAKSISATKVNNVTEFKEEASKGISATISGVNVRVGSRNWVAPEQEEKNDLASRVYVSWSGKFLGYFLIRKEYRKGIKSFLKSLSQAGIQTHLLSGDNAAELKNLSDVFEPNRMHFNQTPQTKLTYISDLQSKGKKVLMVGDGLNDAGALKQADVGVSVSDDVYNFTPASDAILTASNLVHLLKFKAFSEYTMRIVRISFAISITYNSIGMAAAVMGYVTPLFAAVLMPISSISVVGFIVLSLKVFRKFSISIS